MMKNIRHDISRRILTVVLISIVCFIAAPAIAGFLHGFVYTRDVVTNDAGNYTWGEFNPQTGAYVRDIGEATGDLSPSFWRVMSGDEYRSYVKKKKQLHEAQTDLVLLTRAQYEAGIPLADGTNMSSPPMLARSTAYVSVIPQVRRIIDDPINLIQAEYPINPDATIGDDILSMLHKFNGADLGQTKNMTTNRIGFKTAFAKDKDGNPVPIDDNQAINGYKYEAVGPIAGAIIEGWSSGTVSGSDGAFGLYWPSIPCFYFGYSIDGWVSIELHYQRFNPKSPGPTGLYMDLYPTADTCTASFYIVPFFGPYPTGWSITSYPTTAIQFGIDLTVLSGTAQLSDSVSTVANRVQLSGAKVPVGAVTQYSADTPDSTATVLTSYDFDRDGTYDTILMGHMQDDGTGRGIQIFVAGPPNDLQGVWLSSGGVTPQTGQPDFTRVADSASFSDTSNQGLLSQVSAEDLRNTDIYIVRVSDGKLISERIGLNEYEANRISAFGEDAANSQFFYTIQMQGSTGDKRFRYNEFEQWQSSSGINPDLHQRNTDLLQPGDAIRIYAINRATGYIGSVETQMQAGTLGAGNLSFHIDPIIMGPPNLRIKAERGYKITKGATATDKTITQTIGFEGASLTSDKTVTITTEWLDHEGRPLPESLEGAGYTGRIAILSGDQTLPNDNQGVYQFSIDPGKRLQVLQLPNALTDSQHFYIHVSGEPQSGNPIFVGSTDSQRLHQADFSSTGQNPGILAKRPDHYVPFLVPIYDENLSEMQTQAYRILKQTDPNKFNEPPDPIYQWVYRPEMQFTSYDLTVNEIKKSRDLNQNGTIEPGETVNILNDETPLITSDSVIDILYSLSTTNLLPLDYFNAGDSKELVFVVGEQEFTATVVDNHLVFNDLNHLTLLSPDDFLTIRLYANNDMGNVLWQWAFMNMDVDIDSDNNNDLNMPDRSAEEELVENEDGKPGKMLLVNDGDTDGDDIPDFADFDPGAKLAPMVVEIPDDVDITTAKIRFTYEQSDPNNISVDNSVTPAVYTPDTGFLRIWNKNGNLARNVADFGSGGDFIRSEQTLNLNLFTLDANRVMVLYVESVREKDDANTMKVLTEIIEN